MESREPQSQLKVSSPPRRRNWEGVVGKGRQTSLTFPRWRKSLHSGGAITSTSSSHRFCLPNLKALHKPR